MSRGYAIFGANSLPLTYREEITHVILWQKKRNRESHEILVKNYILFTVKKVRMMYRDLPLDAVMQIAHRCLLQSIEGFDPARCKVGRLCNLIPWFARVANKEYLREGELVKLPASKQVGFRFISLDSSGFVGQESERNNYEVGVANYGHLPDTSTDSLFDESPSALEEALAAEKNRMILGCLHLLPTKQRRVLEKVYYRGLSFAQIAREKSPPLTREAVRQQHTKALHELRKIIQEQGIVATL